MRLKRETEEENKLCNTDLIRQTMLFNQELENRRASALAIPDEVRRAAEEGVLDEEYEQFAADQASRATAST